MAKSKQQADESNAISLKSLTKSSIWDFQENDVFRMLDAGMKDAEIRENLRHYIDLIKNAFELLEIKEEGAGVKKSYEKKGYKVGAIKYDEQKKALWALKKKPIMRITDLSYENIRHISAGKLMEVLSRNFGGGWDSLPQSIQDIILSGFDISTTTLPKDRLHKKGGMYEKKVADGYEVLEIPKGTWVEAIFAKLKPETIKPRVKYNEYGSEDDEDEDADVEIEDNYNAPDEDDDILEEPNDDEITEDNYRTTFDIETDPDEDAESLSDYIADE